MIGLEIKFRELTVNAATKNGVVSCVVGREDDQFFISCRGMDKESLVSNSWIESYHLQIGEEVEIRIKNMEISSESLCARHYAPDSCVVLPTQKIPAEDALSQQCKRIKHFHHLENCLRKEGLI